MQAVRYKRIGKKGKQIKQYTSEFIKHTELSGDHPLEARWEDGFRAFVKGATQALIWPDDFEGNGGGGGNAPGPGGAGLPNTSKSRKQKVAESLWTGESPSGLPLTLAWRRIRGWLISLYEASQPAKQICQIKPHLFMHRRR